MSPYLGRCAETRIQCLTIKIEIEVVVEINIGCGGLCCRKVQKYLKFPQRRIIIKFDR